MPFHTDEYIRMIEIVLLKFYEKCFERFHCKSPNHMLHCKIKLALTRINLAIAAPDNKNNINDRSDEYPISLSANWAQEEDIVALLTQSPYFSGEKASIHPVQL